MGPDFSSPSLVSCENRRTFGCSLDRALQFQLAISTKAAMTTIDVVAAVGDIIREGLAERSTRDPGNGAAIRSSRGVAVATAPAGCGGCTSGARNRYPLRGRVSMKRGLLASSPRAS